MRKSVIRVKKRKFVPSKFETYYEKREVYPWYMRFLRWLFKEEWHELVVQQDLGGMRHHAERRALDILGYRVESTLKAHELKSPEDIPTEPPLNAMYRLVKKEKQT